MSELGPILAIAQRDLMKLLRDRPRLLTTLVFPLLLIGVLVLSHLSSQEMAGQIFTFVMLPQFFLAGIFSPIKVLPPYLEALSRISPMRYAVDLARGAFYAGRPEYRRAVLDSPIVDLAVMAVMFTV